MKIETKIKQGAKLRCDTGVCTFKYPICKDKIIYYICDYVGDNPEYSRNDIPLRETDAVKMKIIN